MAKIKTDCRSDVGIAVGVIDTIINQCRIFKRVPKEVLESFEVQESLKDLKDDEDFNFIILYLLNIGV